VPLRPNDSDANMALNRRVEFLLATQETAIARWIEDQSLRLCEGEGCPSNQSVGRKFIAVPTTLPTPPVEERKLPIQRPIEFKLKPPIFEVPAPRL
jgi:hypothetical protein